MVQLLDYPKVIGVHILLFSGIIQDNFLVKRLADHSNGDIAFTFFNILL